MNDWWRRFFAQEGAAIRSAGSAAGVGFLTSSFMARRPSWLPMARLAAANQLGLGRAIRLVSKRLVPNCLNQPNRYALPPRAA